MPQDERLNIRLLSSLEKVFADEELKSESYNKGSMLSNEVYSFQVAYHWTGVMQKQVGVNVRSELSQWIAIRQVGLVPSEMPCYFDYDENVLRTVPGLYPDPLMPLDIAEGLTILPGQWRSIWITVETRGEVKAGTYPITVVFLTASGDELGEASFHLEIFDDLLPRPIGNVPN